MANTSDTTPLLADSEPLEAGEYQLPQDGTITTPVQRKPTDYRKTILLTHLAAALSIVAFLFDLTVICIDFARPGGFYLFWNLRERLQILFAIVRNRLPNGQTLPYLPSAPEHHNCRNRISQPIPPQAHSSAPLALAKPDHRRRDWGLHRLHSARCSGSEFRPNARLVAS